MLPIIFSLGYSIGKYTTSRGDLSSVETRAPDSCIGGGNSPVVSVVLLTAGDPLWQEQYNTAQNNIMALQHLRSIR